MAWKNVQYENGKYRTSEGGGGGSSTFADLEDVNFSNLQNGQVPKYNSATQKWENANESGGGGTVTDVKVDGQSVVDPQTGEADITMPTIPVEDVEVNGESVVNAQKVAEIKSYKEVTQSEYNALPDSKLNDGILYAIKDVGGSDGFPPLIYSDEEREVGVWRDGKPLYQKTYITQNTSINTPVTMADLSSLNIDTVVDYYGEYNRYVSGTGDNIIYKFNSYQSSTVNNWIRVVNKNTLQYQINQNSNVESTNYQAVTILYTKSIDTAGSGTWTTQGALAHHYSTDEHIIGTWINGKPLYEKTVSFNAIPQNSNNVQIVCGLSNPDIIISIKAIAKSNSVGDQYFELPLSLVRNAQTEYGMAIQGYIKSTDSVRLDTGTYREVGGGYVTLQYTKTTD